MLRNTNRTLSVKLPSTATWKREKALAQQQKELFKAQARMTELDTLFRKLYEDNALGRLTDERLCF